ncbi:DNA cytosine methyltransferase [Herbaspirillum rhizosphaerae]|uniref:Cytosine-specific methyltransferase n=1 Tax=Herbaspirillum rhizosphaerae TaxID=346179 RepID=A0ABW8Z441_9BURK
MTEKFTAVSLFTGAGGMDIGFQKAGFNIVWANELMPHAAATYDLNHREGVMHRGDINDVFNELPKPGTIDCVIGGPPCQGFSVAGKMDLDDERSKLVFSYMDVVEYLKPSVFVMENVKALASLAKFSAIRDELMRRAQVAGYCASLYLLNAKDFGVPQSRERVFFVGFRKSMGIVFNAAYFEKYKKDPLSVREILTHFGPAGTEKNPLTCKAKITLAENPVMRKSPYAGMLFNGLGRPINTDGVSCTLPASMGGNKTPIIDEAHVFEGKENWVENYHSSLRNGGLPLGMNDAPSSLRRITVKEAAAIQTFPLDYKFSGPISSQYTQIGNAVPSDLAKAVAFSVSDALSGVVVPKGEKQGEIEFS